MQDIGKDLGVGYVLEGSVRRAGDRLRITAQLIDAATGHHLWAERYDRQLVDIFDLQDEITNKIVSALSIELLGAEAEHLSQRPTSSFEAYDLFLKGQRLQNQLTLQSLMQAEALYRQALELDPRFARAHGALGVTLARQYQIDFESSDAEHRIDQALKEVETAVSIDPASPQAEWSLGFVRLVRREFEQAAEAVERAVVLSPSYADGWALLSAINSNLGRGDQALRNIRKARSLNPRYTWNYPYNEGRAHYLIGDYEQAVEQLLDALSRNQNAMFPRLYLAAAYIRLGRIDDAEWEVMQLETTNPGISLSTLEQQMPLSQGPHRDHFLEDLAVAGLPQ